MHIEKEMLESLRLNLIQEKASLEKQLGAVSNKDENVKGNYNAKFQELGDEEEQNAEEVAEYERRLDFESKFEVQLQLVNKALKKIEDGAYGICEKTGEEIPVGRLQVIPWAECTNNEAS